MQLGYLATILIASVQLLCRQQITIHGRSVVIRLPGLFPLQLQPCTYLDLLHLNLHHPAAKAGADNSTQQMRLPANNITRLRINILPREGCTLAALRGPARGTAYIR